MRSKSSVRPAENPELRLGVGPEDALVARVLKVGAHGNDDLFARQPVQLPGGQAADPAQDLIPDMLEAAVRTAGR